MTEVEWRAEFAKRLQRKMDRQGIDQRRLSQLTGLSEGAISKYISGQRTPKIYSVVLIAKALNSSLYEIMPSTK